MEKQKTAVNGEVAQFGTIRGHERSGGWEFTVTDAIRYLGVDAEDVKGPESDRAVIVFNEPSDGSIDGVLKRGSDIPDGRGAKNARSLIAADQSLSLWLNEETLHDIGVDCDIENGVPPIIDLWAGDGMISIRQPQTKEVAVEKNPNIALYSLPDQIRADFEAIELEGYSVEEWADERDLARPETSENLPEHYIRNNVERAKAELDDDTIAALKAGETLEGDEVMVDLLPVDTVQIRKADGKSIVGVTEAVRRALPEEEHGKPTTITYSKMGWIAPGALDTYEDNDEAPTGYGNERVRKMDVRPSVPDVDEDDAKYKYRVKIPDPVLADLGYDPDDIEGETIVVYSGEETADKAGAIAFEKPDTQQLTVEEPDLIEQDTTWNDARVIASDAREAVQAALASPRDTEEALETEFDALADDHEMWPFEDADELKSIASPSATTATGEEATNEIANILIPRIADRDASAAAE